MTWLVKDELGRKIKTKCVGLRTKNCNRLIDDGSDHSMRIK